MEKMGILLLLLVCSFSSFGQLNCKTSKKTQNESVKTCFHKNGKVSTEEIWDLDKRFGSIRGFNNEGRELFLHYLRSVGGHASVSLEYFANGQVSKVYFSDAPDGGIQFYNSTTKFDESGNQTEFQEAKYPLELEEITSPSPMPEIKSKEEVESPNEPIMPAPVIFTTVYRLQNLTSSRLKVSIKALPNNVVVGTGKEVILKPFESLVFDTVFMADQFVTAQIYQPEILKIETKSRKNKKITVTEFDLVGEGVAQTHYWFFVSEEVSTP